MANSKIWIPLSCLLVTSCGSKGYWKEDHIYSGSSEFSSTKLSYLSPDSNNAVQMEIFQTKESLMGYLYVQATPIPAFQDNPKKAEVHLQIEEKSFSYIVTRHEGGHKLLLSEEILLVILEALAKKATVFVKLQGYRANISPEGFEPYYKRFQSLPKLPQLIQLPI